MVRSRHDSAQWRRQTHLDPRVSADCDEERVFRRMWKERGGVLGMGIIDIYKSILNTTRRYIPDLSAGNQKEHILHDWPLLETRT